MTVTVDATEIVQYVPEPMLPMAVDQAAAAMTAYQDLTAKLLKADDWQGIPGRDQSFVKRRGWAKLATFYGVSTEIRSLEIDRDDEGGILRARCIARATHPNGRYAEGDGACSVSEPRFAREKGRQKVDHDLPATATTRAVNRAISNLIGFGEVSAEEVDGSELAPPTAAAPSQPALPWGPLADDPQMQEAANLVRVIAAPHEVDAEKFVLAMGQKFDGVPAACVVMLRGLARFLQAARSAEPEAAPEPEPRGPDPSAVYPPAESGQRYQGD